MANNPDPVALAREALAYLKMEWAKGSCGNMLALPIRAVADLEKLAKAVLDQDARIKELETALRPFAIFSDKWDANPISNLSDNLYTIHAGDDAASFRLSDCNNARAALAGKK